MVLIEEGLAFRAGTGRPSRAEGTENRNSGRQNPHVFKRKWREGSH